MQTETITLDRAKIMLSSIFERYHVVSANVDQDTSTTVQTLYANDDSNSSIWQIVLDSNLTIVKLINYATWREVYYSQETANATQYLISREAS